METAAMGYDGGGAVALMASGVNNGADVRERSPSFLPQGDEPDVIRPINLKVNQDLEGGPHPERPGELDCAYYIRTGLCGFGKSCKFNHPINRKSAAANAKNKGEFPERLGEMECQYYLMRGTCKFGATCKFHHPRDKAGIDGTVQLNILGFPLRPNELECSYYLRTRQCKFGDTCKFHHPQPSNNVISYCGSPIYPAVHSPTTHIQQSVEELMNVRTTSFIPSTRWRGPSSYAQVILPQGIVPNSGWNPYTGSPGSASSRWRLRKKMVSVPDSVLSPLGLPIHPEEPLCIFYSRYGICKLGPNCKFNHPMDPLKHVLPSTSSAEVPVDHRMLGSASGTVLPIDRDEENFGNPIDLPKSVPQQIASGDSHCEDEGSPPP